MANSERFFFGHYRIAAPAFKLHALLWLALCILLMQARVCRGQGGSTISVTEPLSVLKANGDSVTFQYQTPNKWLTTVLTTVNGRTHSAGYTYFGDGTRRQFVSATSTGISLTTGYYWNADGDLVGEDLPSGAHTNWTYDFTRRLTGQSTNTGSATIATTYTYGVSGLAGDPSTAPAYLRQITHTVNGAPIAQYTLTHSLLGQLLSYTAATSGGNATAAYGYDLRVRLTEEVHSVPGSSTPPSTANYTYDAGDNLNAGGNGWVYNGYKQLTYATPVGSLPGGTLSYNSNGSVTEIIAPAGTNAQGVPVSDIKTLTYNVWGQVASIEDATGTVAAPGGGGGFLCVPSVVAPGAASVGSGAAAAAKAAAVAAVAACGVNPPSFSPVINYIVTYTYDPLGRRATQAWDNGVTVTTTCFDYDGDTLAGEEVLAPPAASQGFGGFASRGPAPSRGSPAADLASLGGVLAAPADDSLLTLTLSDSPYPRAASYLAASMVPTPEPTASAPGESLSPNVSTAALAAAVVGQSYSSQYIDIDNGPGGPIDTGGTGPTFPLPSGSSQVALPVYVVWSPTDDSTGLDQSGAQLWAGIPTDAFGNGIVVQTSGTPATPGGPYAPQPQQDGTIWDPTGLRTGSNGNGVYNPASGSNVEGGDLLGPNGENLMYRPFLNGVNRLAKVGQVAGNVAGAFNPLVNLTTVLSKQNPDGSCASKGQRAAAGLAAAGAVFGEFAEAGEAAGAARGGVYKLVDEDGNVMRTGRTKDLIRREAEHQRSYPDLKFQIIARTDDNRTQRGLEQMAYDRYPNAPLNKERAIRLNHPLIEDYLAAAQRHIASHGVNW